MSKKKRRTRTLNFDIPLTAKQTQMYNALNDNRYKEVLFYGSSRSGKTFLIFYFLVIMAVAYKANCLVFRALFTSLQQGMILDTMPKVLNVIAQFNGYESYEDITMANGRPFAKFNGKDNYLRFWNGARIQFASLRGSADSEKTFDKILSTEWAFAYGDEASEIEERASDVIKTRLAQRIDGVRNKLMWSLNPTRKSGWTYVRFIKNENRDGLTLPKSVVDSFLVMKFHITDNSQNVTEDYHEMLMGMSTLARKRFEEGEYFDESEGEIFNKINWSDPEKPIQPHEWSNIIIYTDPSAKDTKTADYKATVMIGKARNAFYLIDALAVQGTSLQMMQNIHELYIRSPRPELTRIVMEKKQVPVDFMVTFNNYQSETGWVCPLEWDTRVMGDKFTAIESILEPLFKYDRFFFNYELRDTQRGELAVNQFLFFSAKEDKNRKDDIPDACMRAVSLLNRNSPIKYDTKPKNNVFFVKRKRASFF